MGWLEVRSLHLVSISNLKGATADPFPTFGTLRGVIVKIRYLHKVFFFYLVKSKH